MRDLIMAAVGAASFGLGVVIAFVLIKRRERAERHREFTGGESGEFTVTMHKNNKREFD